MKTLLPALVVGLLLALLLVGGPASPASADARIGLSRDGRTWTPSLDGPLFAAAPWVPGESRTATFYVRNQADDSANLTIDLVGRTVGHLVDTGDVTITARGGGGPWQDLSTPDVHRLVSALGAGSREAAKVVVRVSFEPTARHQVDGSELQMVFRIGLTQDVSHGGQEPGRAAAPSSEDGPRILPFTGAPALWSGIIGVTLVAAGSATVLRRREAGGVHEHP